MSAVQVLKIGVVGLGRLGRRHAENLLRHVPDLRPVRSGRFLRQIRATSGGIFLDCSVHDIELARDRCGFFADGTIAVHRGFQNPSRNPL
jgi:hypothetical protein